MTDLMQLPVVDLEVDPVNPRKSLDGVAVQMLAVSIKRQGVLEPLVVRRSPAGGWWVTSGQTRLAAAVHAGLQTVPCIVRDDLADDTAALLAALTSNTSSTPMLPTDEARAYERLVASGMTQAGVGEACKVAASRVSVLLKLLTLDDDIQAQVNAGKVGLKEAVRRHQRRYASGQGVPRGRAARRAREAGPQSAVHLSATAVALLLGLDHPSAVGYLSASGALTRDPVSGGYPLHTVAAYLARLRAPDAAVSLVSQLRVTHGRRPVSGDAVIAVRYDLARQLTRAAGMRGVSIEDVLDTLLRRRAA